MISCSYFSEGYRKDNCLLKMRRMPLRAEQREGNGGKTEAQRLDARNISKTITANSSAFRLRHKHSGRREEEEVSLSRARKFAVVKTRRSAAPPSVSRWQRLIDR